MKSFFTLLLIILAAHLSSAQNSSSKNSPASGSNVSDELIQVGEVSPSAISIQWNSASRNENALRYRELGKKDWIVMNTGKETSFQLKFLKPKTHYELEVLTGGNDSWSEPRDLRTIGRPNIVVIVADDGRYDNYAVTGGPSFFSSPHINSIAEEGANFKYCFPSFSLCSPSRANIISGLMSHHTGVVSNHLFLPGDSLFPTVSEILHDSGYYGIWIGKYGFQKFPQPGYDKYLESSNDYYWNTGYFTNEMNPNGEWLVIPGHKTNVFTQAAEYFLDNAPTGVPFFMFLDHKAPHVPLEPRAEDSDLYELDTMPFPVNYYQYLNNYPSYLYQCHNAGDSAEIIFDYRKYYQLLAGVDYSVGVVLDWLNSHGVLDSTLVIYMSDNGLMKGEHILEGKQLPQEESIRLPLFIRYPQWFAPNTHIDNEFTMNIDIAPTMIDAAGITNPVYMDGVSLHDLAMGTKHRSELLYEHSNKDQDCTPTYRTIRDFHYKYTIDYCNYPTEEFFDLDNDSLENFNEINNPAYQDLVALYRLKLDTLRIQFGDTLEADTIVPCYLAFATHAGEVSPEDYGLNLSPNPGNGDFVLEFVMEKNLSAEISITDVLGRKVYERRVPYRNEQARESFSLHHLANGVYLIRLRSGGITTSLKYVKG